MKSGDFKCNYCLYIFGIQVIVFGFGLEKLGVVQNKWIEFTVDVKKAGKVLLSVSCLDVDLKLVSIEVLDKKDGIFQCKYMFKKFCKYTIIIIWGGVQIFNLFFRVSFYYYIGDEVCMIRWGFSGGV